MSAVATDTLGEIIRRRIGANGPIGVDAYMALCLGHPEHGYYRRRAALGAEGDFITAPEISQIFGELLGLWLAHCWIEQGAPARFLLAELGPGRGVLIHDALRAARIVPGFVEAAELWLVETSERLRAEQSARLSDHAPRYAETLDALPEAPLYLVANEFFDALPVRQFQRRDGAWRERRVGLDGDRLAFRLDDAVADIPDGAAPEGGWLERSPAGPAVAAEIGRRLAASGGAALIVDYGYTEDDRAAAGWRETLQAMRRHAYADPLDHPGEADLTAHVNFTGLARALSPAPAHGPISQGALLRRLGVEARAAALARSAPARAAEIVDAQRRLTEPDQMGTLFKALAAVAPGAPAPAGFEGAQDG